MKAEDRAPKKVPGDPTQVEVGFSDFRQCPWCTSNEVVYDDHLRRHRCQRCSWREERTSLPLDCIVTGGPLTSTEMYTLLQEELRRYGVVYDSPK